MNEKTNHPASQEEASGVDKSLETVRDILFGNQSREHDKRAKGIEKALTASVSKLAKELDSQVNRIEQNIEKLKDQLAKQAARTSEEINQQFDETANKIEQLEKATKAAHVDLHEDLTADRMELEKKTQSWNDALAAQLETVHQNLLHAKTDRSTLSDLLHGMADSIAEEPSGKAKK